jgi:DNA replication and repair protein RecF
MFLKKLSLTNFKNYLTADFDFSEKINCFVGNNGVGKTNLLDAIYYLSFTKSYFNLVDQQNILFDEEFFRLQGLYEFPEFKNELVECLQKRNHRKIFKLNKKEYERIADHIGLLPLVMISPSDSNLVTGGSEERRKYMDSVISQFDKIYLDDLINYQKALFQRNRLLKSFGESHSFDQHALEVWDVQLIALGNKIHEKRLTFINSFQPIFAKHFEFICGGKEEVGIVYESQLNTNDFTSILSQNLSEDRAAAYTTTGIHKDDLIFTIRDLPLKKFGSQGQQKSFVVALKLAQFDYTRDIKGYKPILLFDDIFDKLDDFRVERLVHLVSDDHFGQIFITDTSPERIRLTVAKIKADYVIFAIDNGKAEIQTL